MPLPSQDAPVDAPRVVLLGGPSMRPLLAQGSRLLVAPLCGPPAAGDVVLLRAGAGEPAAPFLVHRVVWIDERACPAVVFHRGDAGGRPGLAAATELLGRVVGVLDPPGQPPPTLERLPRAARRAFRRAQLRCRLYALLRRWLPRAGPTGRRWAQRLLAGTFFSGPRDHDTR